MKSIVPADVWDHIDRTARITCCVAMSTEKCKGHHQEGTRVIYGYEALCRTVKSSLHAARNTVLDNAIDEISKVTPADGLVRKSEVLEILNGLKWPSA